MANSSWARVPLNNILLERNESPSSDLIRSGKTPIISKIRFSDGRIEIRNESHTKTKMILIQPGDLVLSGINAMKGAVAIYDSSVAAAATIHYSSYQINKTRANARFVWWLLRSPNFRTVLQEQVPQGIKTELKAKRLLSVVIPLPTLEEQRRIIGWIDALVERIAEARALQAQAVNKTEAIARSLLDQIYVELTKSFGTTDLKDVCVTITDGNHITPKFSDAGIKFIFVGNVSSGHLHFGNCKYVPADYFEALRPQRQPEIGDVLYTAVGATLGIPAVVDKPDKFCFQRHVAILKVDQHKLDPKFLWYQLRSETLFKHAWANTTGSAQPTVPLGAIRKFPVAVPPMDEQRRIVLHLDKVQARVDALKQLQGKSQEELDALLPSVLDKAFRGEL